MMATIKIVGPEIEEVLDGVETWFYDRLTLVVCYENGQTAEFDRANVVERL